MNKTQKKTATTKVSQNPSVFKNILELRNITKTFLGGKVVANDDISLSFREGEIHAIVGENGSGKSTLMNIIFGLYKQDKGDIFLNEKIVDMFQSGAAKKYSIGMVHQHFHIVENFTVLENVILGQEEIDTDNKKLTGMFGSLKKKEILARFEKICKKYKINIDANAKVSTLAVGQRQMVEILKVLWISKKIIVFDEPTATLSVSEIEALLNTIKSLKKEGKTIIFISHKLEEIKLIADRVSVLRKGVFMGTHINDDSLNTGKIAKEMIGREIKLEYPKRKIEKKDILEVENLSYVTKKGFKALNEVSFSIREGEIFGIAGIEGNGQEQIMNIISGLRKPATGTVKFRGKILVSDSGEKMDTPSKNILMSHIPIDRYMHGMVKELSLKYNSMITTFETADFSSLWLPKTKDVILKRKLIDLKLKIDLLKEELKEIQNTKKVISLKIKFLKNENILLEEDMLKTTQKEKDILNKKIKANIKKIDALLGETPEQSLDNKRKDQVVLKELEKNQKLYKNLTRKMPIRNFILDTSSANKWTNKIIKELNVDGAYENSIPISNLSGGNQQKFIVGREILKEHELILAGHPTRGLDISAIDHIYKKMIKNSEGKATLLYSLEISELVAVCDRMAIMYKGKIVDIVNPKETSMNKISKMLVGQVK